MVVFGRVVDGGERRGRSCRRPQVLAANLLLQVLDNQCSGGLLLVCIDRTISADFRSVLSAIAAFRRIALGL